MRRFLVLAFALMAVGAACADEGAAPPTTAPSTSEVAVDGTDDRGQDPSASVTPSPTGPSSPDTTRAGGSTTASQPLVPLEELVLDLEVVADGFFQPVFAVSPPGDDRLFVVDQPGVVWVIDGGDPQTYLDVRDRVRFGGEQGLLGLAFAPDHSESGLLYLDYTTSDGATRVSEFRGQDAASERVVLEIAQPAANHNGGMIAFGPDGYLWVGMGDGGDRDDRFRNGQDPETLLGGLLRIDVAGEPYTIPGDNPATDNPAGDFAPEVWAIGLRNPWRFSFDGTDLWIGDVGQNTWEEIDRIDATQGGLNFGWPRYEASHCYLATDCDDADLIAPVYEYGHDEGRSVTGGYVYRGDTIPELDGHYLFGDFIGGWVRGLSPDGEVTEWFESGSVPGLSSFGTDAAGEIYVTSTEGALYRLVRR